MPQSSSHTKCPKCGAQANVTSSVNPIRNVVRDYIKCPKCHYEKAVERPPEVTLGDWLQSKKP